MAAAIPATVPRLRLNFCSAPEVALDAGGEDARDVDGIVLEADDRVALDKAVTSQFSRRRCIESPGLTG